MKEQYVRDLGEGMRVDSLFALRSRDIRSARTGDSYLSLEMSDCSGAIPAVMFRPTSADEALPVGSIVRARGIVTTYRGVRRVSVDTLRPVDAFDARDLLPSGQRDREEMLQELRAAVKRVRDARLRAVVRAVFGASGFIDAFATCPAGSGRHHAYVGGLLEHTLAVASLCETLACSYPPADHDLLLAAALLHDVGKTQELSFDSSFEYTDAGRLIGHVVLGERIVTRAIDSLARPLARDVALRLVHAVLSHHGEREWGAPCEPCSLEAVLLHHADNLDAQAAAFLEAVSGAAVLEQRWSDRGSAFGRALLVPAAGAAACRECA
jgi:3'-5' exoribonuclease